MYLIGGILSLVVVETEDASGAISVNIVPCN